MLLPTVALVCHQVYGLLNGFKERTWRLQVMRDRRQVEDPNLLPVVPLGVSSDLNSFLNNQVCCLTHHL